MLKKFKRILIANRGEIAARVIKTARRMGVQCVCVYSDADARSLYVQEADESVYIGASPAAQSYLNIEKICEVAVTTGCQAVHPGYGFLSENPLFPSMLEKCGVDFIGPSAQTIQMMGDKIVSKQIASRVGVSAVPGYMDVIPSVEKAQEVAESIGFPVMIKATSGGGGKGMRIVRSKAEVTQAFQSTTNEAMKNFKDGRIFIEKYIESPRHIEIQILADKFGNIVCLGERECSIQRHNQKVIEEAPSPFLDEETRRKMYEQSIKLAQEVNYVSAGTIEFIVDKDRKFYFLEMNTRLQVEHPVTELVTGIDIVEEMIRVAQGEKLRFTQKNVNITGSAIEARVYAEDPAKNFLPSTGRISLYHEPSISPKVRIDTGVFSGADISMFYDPMIAKISTYGKNRAEAIMVMQKTLNEFNIKGIANNLDFLESIFGHPIFISGEINTGFISQFYPDGFRSDPTTEECHLLFLLSAVYLHLHDEKYHKESFSKFEASFVVLVDKRDSVLHVKHDGEVLTAVYNHDVFSVTGRWFFERGLFCIVINDESRFIKVERVKTGYLLKYSGMMAVCAVYEPHVADLLSIMPQAPENIKTPYIESPISGMVIKVHVAVGDEVHPGQPIFIVEAMKMENVVCSDCQAVIKKVFVQEGSSVQSGEVIVELFAPQDSKEL